MVSTNVSIVLNNVKLEDCIDCPIIEKDQQFVGLKTLKQFSRTFDMTRTAIDTLSRAIGL